MLTLVIVVISTSALYQIIRQKKLSEIKNDFINNISHEFKTPIATINLALDAISTSKNNLNDKFISYLAMIREENSRMLSQVENILRISQLEKSSNPFDMEETNIHEVIEDAIEHVKLIVESKKGSIKLSLKAQRFNINGNSNHLENIIINILDNAVKYSKENPQIIISSTNSNKDIILCFEDNGIGMDKNTQKKGWERFTDAILKKLSDEKEGLVFILWGGFAKKKEKYIDSERHLVLTSGHPSPLSANRGYWFGNMHFSSCNSYLKNQGKRSIEW